MNAIGDFIPKLGNISITKDNTERSKSLENAVSDKTNQKIFMTLIVL